MDAPCEMDLAQFVGLCDVLANPQRLRVLLLLAGGGEADVFAIRAALGMPQTTASQHLIALRRRRLVTSSRTGRGHRYRLHERVFVAADSVSIRDVGLSVTIQRPPPQPKACTRSSL